MRRSRFAVTGLLASVAIVGQAHAQAIESNVPPVFQSVDGNGVDQISGGLVQVMTSIGIGPGESVRYLV